MIKKELLDILVCPKCQESVEYQKVDDREMLICKKCNKAYPIRDDIPIMLIEESCELKEVSK